MAENMDDIVRWVKFEKLQCDKLCDRYSFDKKNHFCRLCLLDATKRKLVRIRKAYKITISPPMKLNERFEADVYDADCLGDRTFSGNGSTELAALAGAVRQMLKEEKR